MFQLGNNGYNMTFENGYTVSVRWHKCIHYVTNRTLGPHTHDEMEAMATDSVNAEVAVLDATGEFIQTPFNESDTVIGWTRPDDVLKIMEWAAAL